MSRILLHESIHDRVLEKILERVRKIKVGHPLDPSTNMGPINNKAQYQKVLSYIDIGMKEGAKLLVDGRQFDGAKAGKQSFAAGAIWVPYSPAAATVISAGVKELGIDAWATGSKPSGKAIALKPVRIGQWLDMIFVNIDGKAKPLGSLGQIEELAVQLGLMRHPEPPRADNAVLMVFAGDHGLTEEGVSQFPSAVTTAMVMTYLAGKACANAFAAASRVDLRVIDACVLPIKQATPV